MDGITKAKVRETTFGRKRKPNQSTILELQQKRAKGELIEDLISECQLSKASIYRYLGDIEISKLSK